MTTEWKLVPKEPTDEQIVRGAECLHDCGVRFEDDDSEPQQDIAEALYRAMLAAAPAMTDAQMEAATLSDEAAIVSDVGKNGSEWKLAPAEPTRDMSVAGADEGRWSHEQVNVIYRAMLAAAPAAPVQQAEPVAWYDSESGAIDFHTFKPSRKPSSPSAEWVPLYLHPPAAPMRQTEPVAWRVRAEWRTKPGQFGPWRYFDNSGKPVVNSPDDCAFEPLYLHPPAAEVQRLRNSLRWAIREIERSTCTHEETHRGGAIWTICDHCDSKWADDEGGFVPYVEPPELIEARAALEGVKP